LKEYIIPPEIENFRYWYGDVKYGEIFYLSTQDISGFEAEIHMRFSKKKISSFLLILGPTGLTSRNCLQHYRGTLNLLNKKYGHFTYQRVIKDPIIDDLVSSSVCDPIRIGGYSIKTYWKLSELTIISEILADDDGYYIETEYIYGAKKIGNRTKNLLKLL
jgi:hypothetical protein